MSVLEVTELLNLVRKSIKTHKYDMVPTAKNRESKRKYGLTQLDIEYFILSLKADNLYKGQKQIGITLMKLYMFLKKK